MKKLLILSAFFFLLFSCKKEEASTVSAGSSKQLFNTLGVHEDYIVAHWKLDGNGSDDSGYGNAATLHNLKDTIDRFGNPAGALYFNGTDGYATVEDTLPLRLSNTDFTVSAWIKLDNYNKSSASMILSKEWKLGVSGTNLVAGPGLTYFQTWGDMGSISSVAATASDWHMITVVYVSNNLTRVGKISFYLDGVLNGVAYRINAPLSTGVMGYIGRSGDDIHDSRYNFKGIIDDIRVYKGAATPSLVAQLYQLR